VQGASVSEVVVAPGNAGTATEQGVSNRDTPGVPVGQNGADPSRVSRHNRSTSFGMLAFAAIR